MPTGRTSLCPDSGKQSTLAYGKMALEEAGMAGLADEAGALARSSRRVFRTKKNVRVPKYTVS